MADLLEGADAEGYEDFCEEVYNALKNNWRQSDPCTNVSEKQPGMILSDEDDEKLYHVGLDSYICDEILQERRSFDAIPIFQSVDLGIRQIMSTTRARAYLGTDQDNLVDTVYTAVQLDTEDYDSGGNFNVGTYKFTCPVAGFYLVIGQVMFHELVADASYYAVIKAKGVYTTITRVHSSFNSWLAVRVTDILYLTAAQTIELFARQDSGGNLVDVTAGTNYTYLAVHLLSI